ncbi:M1 family metallopeptidase [Granulicella sp. WH15]|uniref:M1 family metallopeptidase n=1 Tax=Granulicella sp. WH15 TaxID=2602070 RepID=UPI0013675928|nr:M1 family metallopeptidase [Granulicella sp. WH15]QHN04371.1 M1 family metallopeptidase [Granulicella sp. WH15]
MLARCFVLFALGSIGFAQTTTLPKTPGATTSTTNPSAQAQNTAAVPPATPTRAEILRGAYGPFRANNDLLYYHLDVRVDPVAKTIAGKNSVRFKMLSNATRIQIDLTETLTVDKIVMGTTELHYTRDAGAVFIDFPETLHTGQTYTIDFFYSGKPVAKGRFGGMVFDHDSTGRPWINTACEDDGSSIWWPSKDQWRDEPQEGMDISVAVPNGLTDVSNGRFLSKQDLGDGYTQWNWRVHYPINSYDVALNIGAYEHFSDTYKANTPLTLDFYALPEDLDKAKTQFAQAKGMLDAFTHYFGPYPFYQDGYKLIEVPYAGMEHQSAVAYGNHFANGYLNRDWTGVGISPRFDFIIIHESGHEWFGNAVTAADRADMWIHEGWTTYLESLYVEFHYGKPDALKYLGGLVPKVRNRTPIITEPGTNQEPPQDQYFKAALMIATLRSVVDNDPRWFTLIHDFYQHFKYQTTTTEAVVAWWNASLKQDMTPFFNQYLRRTTIPTLELNFDEAQGIVMYKWQAEEPGFAMPVKVGSEGHWQTIHPTREWQWMKTGLSKEQFSVATELFFVNVSKT